MISAWDMGRKIRAPDGRPAEVDRLVWELTGRILQEAERLQMTDAQLGKKAKRNPSVLYGYRNGSRKSPSLLVLSDFAAAVGLTPVLSGGTELRGLCKGSHVTTEDERDIIGWVRALPSDADRAEVRRMVRDFYLSKTSSSRPLRPAEQME